MMIVIVTIDDEEKFSQLLHEILASRWYLVAAEYQLEQVESVFIH